MPNALWFVTWVLPGSLVLILSLIVLHLRRKLRHADLSTRRMRANLDILKSIELSGLVICDSNGCIQWINHTATRMLTNTDDQNIVGVHLRDLCAIKRAGSDENMDATILRVLLRGETFNDPSPLQLFFPSGRTNTIRCSARMLYNDDLSRSGALFIFRDLSNMVDLERQHAETLERLDNELKKAADFKALTTAAAATLPFGIRIIDAKKTDHVLYVNPAGKKIEDELIRNRKSDCDVFSDLPDGVHPLPCVEGNTPRYFDIHRTRIRGSGEHHYIFETIRNVTNEQSVMRQLNVIQEDKTALEGKLLFLQTALKPLDSGDSFLDCAQAMAHYLGVAHHADGCFAVFSNVPGEDETFDQSVQWVAAGRSQTIQNWNLLNLRKLPSCAMQLSNSGYLEIEDVENYPDITAAIARVKKEHQVALKLRALLCFDIKLDGKVWGMLGLTYIAHPYKFSRTDRETLLLAQEILNIARAYDLRSTALKRTAILRKVIFDNMHMPIFLYDADGLLLNVNRAGCELANKSEEEILCLPCHVNFCKKNKQPGDCPVRKCIRSGTIQHFDEVLGDRSYHVIVTPVFDTNNELSYILKTTTDMTAVLQREKELSGLVEHRRGATQRTRAFVMAAHRQLRTQINTLCGYSALMKLPDLAPDDAYTYAEVLHKTAQNLLHMIENIIEIALNDVPNPDALLQTRIQSRTFFDAIARQAQRRADARALTFKCNITPLLPDLYFDANSVTRVVNELLDNAFTFTSAGEIGLYVSFKPDNATHGMLKIAVVDTGIGISQKLIPTIFNPFVRDAKVAEKAQYIGAGLGLTTVKRIVLTLGGHAECQSRENIGSTFTVILPAIRYTEEPL